MFSLRMLLIIITTCTKLTLWHSCYFSCDYATPHSWCHSLSTDDCGSWWLLDTSQGGHVWQFFDEKNQNWSSFVFSVCFPNGSCFYAICSFPNDPFDTAFSWYWGGFFGLDNHSVCTLERTPLCSPLYISCPFTLQLCYLAASFMQPYISLLTPLVAALLTYSCKMLAYCVLLCHHIIKNTYVYVAVYIIYMSLITIFMWTYISIQDKLMLIMFLHTLTVSRCHRSLPWLHQPDDFYLVIISDHNEKNSFSSTWTLIQIISLQLQYLTAYFPYIEQTPNIL